jgi:hypothetical protein
MRNLLLALLFVGVAHAEEHHDHSKAPPSNPTFDKLKTLTGNWEGMATEGDKKFPSKTMFKMVSGNSVLMNILAEGSPHEMVTMIHPDLKDTVATHYCAGNNQPRFKAVPAGANQVAFEFKDGTNMGPNDGHMHKVVFTFDGPDHHMEDWTFRDKGKDSTMRFDFKRAAPASPKKP